jgi:G:T-mismatch repair DNA endonuclease (very short patch repair protein)
MADTFSPRERSKIMAKVKGRSNKSTELRLINSTFAPAHSVQHIEITLTF